MAAYLIGEEGPLTGIVLSFEEGMEWTIGRDPDVATLVLEDSMVSRKHVLVHATTEGYLLENLSHVNPATQNGKLITEPVLLKEGDILQIGSTFFRFTEQKPSVEEDAEATPMPPLEDGLEKTSMGEDGTARWLLKVITGPNAGAEFAMQRGKTYLIGKDPNLCDIIFHDLSVSRQHARLSVDEAENIFIEDLGSRNGVLVNGEPISDKHQISSQDLVALGTTTFLLIDRKQVRETIVPPPPLSSAREEKPEMVEAPRETAPPTLEPVRDWKEMTIPRRHLVAGGVAVFVAFLLVFGIVSLFKVEPVVVSPKHESQQIEQVVKQYPEVQFSYAEGSGKLFLVGHVLTDVDKKELLFMIRRLGFIEKMEDNVVVDQYVWQNMNALLISNPDWQGVSIHSPSPGRFVIRGYLQTADQAMALTDYLNINFPYLDMLENQVVIESNLSIQVQSLLIEKGFAGVGFQLTDGELVLAGRVDERHKKEYDALVSHLKGLPGIRGVKNFTVLTTAESSLVDLSDKYRVSGYSRKGSELFVLVNGRIVGKGDILDGMTVTSVVPNLITLEKDGLKFRINYNLQ